MALRPGAGPRHPVQVTGDEGERSYGLWAPVAAFVLLAVVGLGLLLFGGGSDTSTVQVPVSQTFPDDPADEGVLPENNADGSEQVDDESAAPAADPSGTAPPLPEGAAPPLPEGATEVLRDGASTSYSFRPPPGVDGSSLDAVVAPLRVRVGADGRTAELLVGCTRAADEFLAQVVVTEIGPSVTFVAISVFPPESPPCTDGDEPRRVELQLLEPLGERSVVVVPAGTAVPELQPG